MITLKHQLLRLKENHNRCLNNGKISNFLDLTHTMRIFSEYGDRIDDILSYNAEFESLIISKELNKISNKSKFIILPIRPYVIINKTSVGSIFWLGDALPDEEIKRITSPEHNFHRRKYDFNSFWNSQILFVRERKGGEIISLSRHQLVQRASNRLGASHIFQGSTENCDKTDQVIYSLYNQMQILDIPLPFFACFKIAQEILTMCGKFELEEEIKKIKNGSC